MWSLPPKRGMEVVVDKEPGQELEREVARAMALARGVVVVTVLGTVAAGAWISVLWDSWAS